MKKENLDFKMFLNENVNEVKNLLVNILDDSDISVEEIVSFEDDEFGGFIGCDSEGYSVEIGCNLYEDDVEDDDVSVEMRLIEGKRVYFVLYDF
jgi:hypothetical protein